MIKEKLKKIVMFIVNPRLLLCCGVAWIITNGWSYITLALGTWLDIGWMKAIAGGYIAFLWLPGTPEKIVTVAITIALLRWWFPDDEKTLAVLKDMHQKLKLKHERKKDEKRKKRIARNASKNKTAKKDCRPTDSEDVE